MCSVVSGLILKGPCGVWWSWEETAPELCSQSPPYLLTKLTLSPCHLPLYATWQSCDCHLTFFTCLSSHQIQVFNFPWFNKQSRSPQQVPDCVLGTGMKWIQS